ncbi:TonB-dependent receptor [Altererythrobacter aurantiacus]|uniref:TonB-dependent receptor n=1 Tax=Parapontixanthobacter aurantiacus TaxID=1463599 RepID=A0A844ZGQ8_9SPHN|nr:TonB-dependent receptor [Parapontixanthobacter aurantiacus]MXO86958.1 TonB-dependent receptor [Parapontixanthobacter aurantiacus]
MKLKYLLAASVVSLSAAAIVPAPLAAQQITSGIEGFVESTDGTPLAGATVVITDTRTGQQQTITTGQQGSFRADSLITGGPYTVTATLPGFEGQTVENVFINLQGNAQLTFSLSDASVASSDVIVVTGSRVQLTQRAIGPGQSFGAETIDAFPSISRDVRDIIRLDPRVSLDRSNEVDRVSCLGGNERTNAFTVDGIAQSDLFGLNGTPFASRNSLPLPYDAIRETSVEFAPFDVQYGQFTGCAINVVTKSGGNDFHGSAFFTYADDSLQGDQAGDLDFAGQPYKEKRWGATLSGPIIPDRLFFFVGYEETDLGDSQLEGPPGLGFPTELDFVTTEQFNRFSNILSDTYGIDSGGIATDLAQGDVRYFGRIDAIINDNHRLEATYQRLEEENVEPDDFSRQSRVFTGLNSFEEEGTVSDYYSVRVYSDWSDIFSTELRASRADVQDVQGPVGGGEAQSGNPIPRIVVGVSNGTNLGSIVAGPGFSRTSNELNTTVTQLKALGRINADSHTVTIGAEYNELDVFNLFAQNSTGTLTFIDLDDFEAGLLSSGTNTFPSGADIADGDAAGAYGNFTASGDINDAAADWKRKTFSIYAQDDWQASDQLNIVAGVRVEWLSGDAPEANPAFLDRYGFTNANSFGKVDPVILPRLGLTYDFDNEGFFYSTAIRGGVGRFTGGDPAVYFSNAFSNNGFAVGFGRTGRANCGPEGTQVDVVENGQFTGVPACVIAAASASSAGGTADTQSTDPDFKAPTVWRANFGISTGFGTGTGLLSDWQLDLDFIYSKFVNPVDFVDLSQVVNTDLGLDGFTVDGRPIYRAIDPTADGCSAQLQNQGGLSPTYTNVTPACFNTSRDDEIQLTNGKSYESKIASAILTKNWYRGIFTETGAINFNLGYAYTDAENNRYANSSTATSSFDIVAAFDRQNVDVATAEYQSRHNFSLGLNFREQFFGDNDTSFGFVFIARSGRPYSIVQDNISSSVFNDSASGDFNSLLYIPTGIDDPNVVYRDTTFNGAVVQTAEQAAQGLDAFINENDCISEYRGRTIARNSCNNPWFYDLDVRFAQELPGPASLFGVTEDKLELFVDFDNFLNLIDSDANVFERYRYTEAPIQANFDSSGRYVYSNYSGLGAPEIQPSSSLWKIQLGVRYEF